MFYEHSDRDPSEPENSDITTPDYDDPYDVPPQPDDNDIPPEDGDIFPQMTE